MYEKLVMISYYQLYTLMYYSKTNVQLLKIFTYDDIR
jgi:hypothetical protein